MADLDGDGHRDLITGCYEGLVYLLRGTEDGFAPQVVLRDRAGTRIHTGRIWDPEQEKHRTAGEPGERCFSASPVDWDADGDPDLVLGTSEGTIYLRVNEGTDRGPAFGEENVPVRAGGAAARIPTGHAMPVVADWDGDGRWDLLTGSNAGGVYWLRNTGREGAPELAAPEELVARASGGMDAPGRRTQVAAADLDGDGDVDLLVGDYHRTKRGTRYERHGWVWLFRRNTAEGSQGGSDVRD